MTTTNSKIIFHNINKNNDIQIGLYKYFNYLRENEDIEQKIYIVATNDSGTNQSLPCLGDERNKLLYCFFPEFNCQKIFNIGNSLINIMTVCDIDKLTNQTFDMLQFCELSGVTHTFFENNKINKLVVLGSTDKNKHFNIKCDKITSIPFKKGNLDNCYPCSVVNELPVKLKYSIYQNMFEDVVHRESPTSEFCEKYTKRDVKRLEYYKDKLNIDIDNTPIETVFKMNKQINGYIDRMPECNNITNHKQNLFMLYKIVYAVTGQMYKQKSNYITVENSNLKHFTKEGIYRRLSNPIMIISFAIYFLFFGILRTFYIMIYLTFFLVPVLTIIYLNLKETPEYKKITYCDFSYNSIKNKEEAMVNFESIINSNSEIVFTPANNLLVMNEFIYGSDFNNDLTVKKEN